MAQALARLAHAPADEVSFRLDGRRMTGRHGDTVAAALYGAGRRRLGHSLKHHAPRGLSGSFPAGHLATVEGIPHCRLDRMALVEGLDVRTEGAWPTPGLDLLALARLAPRRWLWAGFEHPRAIPNGAPLWLLWERMLARLAGGADAAPRARAGGVVAGRRIAADLVVIGGGLAGCAAAAAASGRVVLVTRGVPASPPGSHVEVLAGHEACALYRGGRLAAAAPHDPRASAVLIDAARVVLATGRISVPPLVPGAALPGVLDAANALALAGRHGVPPGRSVAVIGTRDRDKVAERLAGLGVAVVAVCDAHDVTAVLGRHEVEGLLANGRRILCDAVVHAGPWRVDPALAFQAAAGGELRLSRGELPGHLTVVGDAALPPEPIAMPAQLDGAAYVCPCMDVTLAEIRHHLKRGVTHVEELKRLTGCGMGACQGVPCWDLLAAVVARATGASPEAVGSPSYRAPRGALTFGQAAGLAASTESEP